MEKDFFLALVESYFLRDFFLGLGSEDLGTERIVLRAVLNWSNGVFAMAETITGSEIEVTPEMVEMGKRTFERFVHPDNYEPISFVEDIVTEIYLAMKASTQASICQSDELPQARHE